MHGGAAVARNAGRRTRTIPELLLVLEVVRYLKRHAGVVSRRSDASFDRRASCGGAESSAVLFVWVVSSFRRLLVRLALDPPAVPGHCVMPCTALAPASSDVRIHRLPRWNTSHVCLNSLIPFHAAEKCFHRFGFMLFAPVRRRVAVAIPCRKARLVITGTPSTFVHVDCFHRIIS